MHHTYLALNLYRIRKYARFVEPTHQSQHGSRCARIIIFESGLNCSDLIRKREDTGTRWRNVHIPAYNYEFALPFVRKMKRVGKLHSWDLCRLTIIVCKSDDFGDR